MPENMIEKAAEVLDSQLLEFAASAVIFIDKNGQETEISAVPDETTFDSPDYDGFVVKNRMIDFICRASDLPKMPERNERIKYKNVTHNIVPAGEQGFVYEWTTPFKTTIRVHTKER